MNSVRELKNPLLAALRKDDAERFRTILGKQGWPSNSEWSDYELLLKAIHNDCKSVAWVLLEKGARIFKRHRVNSPIHEAASKLGWTSFVKVLLERGAKVADLNSKGDTALHIAFVHHKSVELVDLLLKAHLCDMSAVEDVVNKDGLSFLHIACTRPYLKFVSALVERGQVDVDIQVSVKSNLTYAGYTPLHFAVAFGQYDVVEHLLSRYDVNVHQQDVNGSTPLHIAIERDDVRMIDLILRYDDSREDSCNRFGLSHFMAVCAGSNESLVEDYLRVAAYRSLTEPDTLVRSQVKNQRHYPNAGYTPLHFAAQYGRFNTAKLLLQLGARCCATASDGLTPSALACQREHIDVYMLLVNYCTDVFREPPTKRRRIFGNESCENVEFVDFNVDFNGDLRKCEVRSSSWKSDDSTLTSSSIIPLSTEAATTPFLIDHRTICVNPWKIFEHGSEMSLNFYDDVHESSVGFEADCSICKRRIRNLETDNAMDYPSISIPKDFELDFHEPLDDIVSNDSLRAIDKTFDDDCADVSKNLDASLDKSSNDAVANDADYIVQLNSFDQQMIFDNLFEEYLENINSTEMLDDFTADDVEFVEFKSFDEQMAFDELMHRFLQDASSSINGNYDFDSSFENDCNDSTANSSTVNQEVFETTDDLDTTLEVTSSSSESDILEEDSKNSCFSDGSSTVAVSSDNETDSVFENAEENICYDRETNLSARSSVQEEVEIVFMEYERFHEDSEKNATACC